MRDLDEGMTILQHLCLEHRHINEVVCATRQLLAEAIEEEARSLGREKVLQALKDLRRLLVRHFQEEEDDGYMEEALVRLPRLTEQVAALHRQHAGMLKELEAIIELARDKTTKAIRGRFQEFARRLLEHEAGENRVMAEAFGTDYSNEADYC